MRFLCLILIGLAGLTYCQPAAAQETQPDKTQTVTQASVRPAPPLKLRAVRLIGRHKGYIVDVRYPQFRGGKKSETDKLNKQIRLYVDRCISNAAAPKGQPAYTHDCNFYDVFFTDEFVSLNLDFSDYLGGAGDARFATCLSGQLKPKFHLLTLRDVLGKRINRTRLAAVVAKSVSQSDQVQFKAKDLASDGQLDSFTFDSDGLSFYIPEGATVGTTKVKVSYQDLGKTISKKSPIYGLAKASKIKHLGKHQARSQSRRHRL